MIGAGRAGGYSAVRVVGGLLPPDVLTSVVDGSAAGLSSGDFHLGGERPQEAAARTWSHLTGVYARFRDDLARLRESDPAVGVTRERWLSQLLAALDYGRVPTTAPGGLTVGDRSFPVSHLWGKTPIHLLGWGVPLDHRTPGVPGAATRAPHAMLQELLNRSEQHQWALLANGRTLRLLRDSTTLTGQAYVEFDLEAVFDGDLYADWALLYLLAHESRVETETATDAAAVCWLERWRTTAVSQGVRALDLLRGGVQAALQTLGTGFLHHPANVELRAGLEVGTVRVEDLHAALLRTVYRLIFWAVAEDREALLDPAASTAATDRYRAHFSSARLRRLARARHGSPHYDLWLTVSLVLSALARPEGEPRLGLPGLGGLFATDAADVLVGASLDNVTLLSAVRSLSIVQPREQAPRSIDFRHLGAEELGSIYESLLELVPRRDPVLQTFSLEQTAGNDRKTTGSYYTPTDLVELVLDTALDPVLDDAEKQPDPEAALLAVTVCDPAIGSGHFMVAAARRIATRLAMVRTGEVDPTPTTLSDAVHDVVAQCIYGVDVNPMAADLAKVSLWLEAMAPGRPLSFLDHHIKVGNALLGTTPVLLAAGIPDAAYVALTGDDRAVVRQRRDDNVTQRAGQDSLFEDTVLPVGNAAALAGTREVAARTTGTATLADNAWAAQRYGTLQASDDVLRARRVADAWCVAFLVPKVDEVPAITTGTLNALAAGTADETLIEVVESVSARHRLFHWHLEFPEIFRVPDAGPTNTPGGWTGGFSAMLGNPPWETLQMSEKEYFAARAPDIAEAPNAAARKRLIEMLASSDPALAADFAIESRRGEAENQLIRGSGRFPLTARGKINTYGIFAELFVHLIGHSGYSGIVTPSGIATSDTMAPFISRMIATRRLAVFADFANHRRRIFAGLKGQSWFAVTVLTSPGSAGDTVRFASDLSWPNEFRGQHFILEASEALLVNPNTGTLAMFRTRREAEITLACYRRHGILWPEPSTQENAWRLSFSQGTHNMSSKSSSFREKHDFELSGASEPTIRIEGWQALIEGKMLGLYNDRYGDYRHLRLTPGKEVRALPRPDETEWNDPQFEVMPRYWVPTTEVSRALGPLEDRGYLFGWRDSTNVTNARTFIPSVTPTAGVGHKFLLANTEKSQHVYLLQSVWSSLIFDFIARQKLSGTSMSYFVVRQLPCPTPEEFEKSPPFLGLIMRKFLSVRVLELTYNSHRIKPYAVDVIGGEPGEPFRWLPDRRAQLMAELDAAMLHLYGVDRDDGEHVLDSFPVVRRYDERDFGEFRTKRLVLAAYDAMSDAARTGVPFRSPLSPPPGDGPRHDRMPA